MTPQQVKDLSSAIKQHIKPRSNIHFNLGSSYHDDYGNPKPKHKWPSEDHWKRRYPSLFSRSSNESQPQKQQVDSLSESEDEDEEDWDEEEIIQSEEETSEEMSSYESDDNQDQNLAETPPLSIHDSPLPADKQDPVGTFPAPPDPTADSLLGGPSTRTASVQHPPRYSSPDIYEGSLGSDPYLPGSGSAGLSTVTHEELQLDVSSVDEELNLPSSSSKAYDEQVSSQEESPGRKQKAGKKRNLQEMITEEIVQPQRKKRKRKKGKAEQGTEADEEESQRKRKKRKKRKVDRMTEGVEGTSRKRRKRKKQKEHRRDKGDEESPRKRKKRKQHKSHRVNEGDEEPRRKRSKRE